MVRHAIGGRDQSLYMLCYSRGNRELEKDVFEREVCFWAAAAFLRSLNFRNLRHAAPCRAMFPSPYSKGIKYFSENKIKMIVERAENHGAPWHAWRNPFFICEKHRQHALVRIAGTEAARARQKRGKRQ